MSEPLTIPLAVTLEAFTDIDFWTGVGILAGIYTIFALGLQLNVGFTGIQNFGQAGFMAIGAYTMAILTRRGGDELLAHASRSRSLVTIALRAPRRPAVAAPARRLLRDRDDRRSPRRSG